MLTSPNDNAPTFEIKAHTYTLLPSSQSPNGLLNGVQYRIPVYQRPYRWRNEEVGRLLKSIITAYLNEREPYFLGTMQLMPKKAADGQAFFDIIDGQQRLTTLLLFFKAVALRTGLETLPTALRYFGWLRTIVSQGEQQLWLDEALSLQPGLILPPQADHNPYVQRLRYIEQLLTEFAHPASESTPGLLVDDAFLKYLTTQLYAVVIETQAGLAKTLDIFNTINTAGMDLNGGDVFKLQIFEYLTTHPDRASDATDEVIFARIDGFYAAVDTARHPNGQRVTSVQELLDFYQHILIERAQANRSLHDNSPDTFYKRLFATLLLREPRLHFNAEKMRAALGPDPLADLHRLLKVRVLWETEFSVRHDLMWCLLSWRTRYERYWRLDFIYLFELYREEGFDKQAFEQWHDLLVRYYIVKTIQFRRTVGEAHSFSYDIMRAILQNATPEALIGKVRRHLASHDKDWFRDDHLRGDVFDNARQRYLISWLLAMLDSNEGEWNVANLRQKFFEGAEFDVEHIRPRNPVTPDAADDNVWKDHLNTIGNLVLLERKLNQSAKVKNHPFAHKWDGYGESKLATIHRLREENADKTWTEDKCQARTEREIERLCAFLFAGCHEEDTSPVESHTAV